MNLKTAAAAAALTITLCGATASDAMAARQTRFYHLRSSERATVLVFHSWNCTNGRAADFVRRGDTAEISVGSVWVPKGYSLWAYDPGPGPGGKGEFLYAKKASQSRCVSMLTRWPRSLVVALKKGNG